jgi:hypothetical protein
MKALSKLRVFALAAMAALLMAPPVVAAADAIHRTANTVKLHVKAVGLILHAHLFNFMARQGLILGANTLTGLIPTLYEALNRVSREMVGFIPAVTRDSNVERAAVNQTVRVPIGSAGALEDITPGATPANSGDTTPGFADVVITKSKAAPIRWNGEEQRAVGSTGVYNALLADQFTDGMRKIVNAMEADLAVTAASTASRAYGTAGTTPLGTAGDLSDLAGVAQILDQNGAPVEDRQIVFNSAAIANLRGKQSVLFKVNEAGSSDMLRRGMTDLLQGMAVRYSGGIAQHVKGTGSGYLVNNAAGYAVGSTGLAVDTGTGTIVAGDIVTLAGDTNKYVGSLSSSTLTLNAPGLVAAHADNDAVTVGNSYTGNFAFSRNALVLACRAPAVPEGGDSADDSMMITDPLTGLTFEVRVYRQYRQVKFEICMAWGTAGIKSEHLTILLG